MINPGVIFFAIVSLYFAQKYMRKRDADGFLFNIMCDIVLLTFWFYFYGTKTPSDQVNLAIIGVVLGIDVGSFIICCKSH